MIFIAAVAFMLGVAAGIMLYGYLTYDENHRLIEERDLALAKNELPASDVETIPPGMANHPSVYDQLIGLEYEELGPDNDYEGWSDGLNVR